MNYRFFFKISSSELIETLWNVNFVEVIPSCLVNNELIETLWNVNTKEYFGGLFGVFGINRNIVECKLYL